MSWAAAFAVVGISLSIALVFWSFAWVTAETGGPGALGKPPARGAHVLPTPEVGPDFDPPRIGLQPPPSGGGRHEKPEE